MDIGTAKPTAAELALAPVHRLIDLLDPTQAYSAADFCRDALREMAAITAAGRIPLLVGHNALLQGPARGVIAVARGGSADPRSDRGGGVRVGLGRTAPAIAAD